MSLFLTIIFLLILGHFIIKLNLNNFNLQSTILYYKNYFSFLFKTKSAGRMFEEFKSEMSNKEASQKKNVNASIEKNIDAQYFDNEKFLPFEHRRFEHLSEIEKEFKQRIIQKIGTRPSYYIENGQRKIILPLEAIVFLNHDFNPLVNEHGEITITIDEVNVSGKKIFEIKNDEEFILDSREDLEASIEIKDIVEHSHKEKVQNNSINIEPIVVDDPVLIEVKLECNDEGDICKLEIEPEEFILAIPEDMLTDDFSDVIVEEAKEKLLNLNDLIQGLEVETSVLNNDTDIKSFLHKKSWEFIPDFEINFGNFEESFRTVFSEKYKFLNNLVKHKYLIMNENKTAIFIDIAIISNSLSRLTGNQFEMTMKKLSKMPAERAQEYKKALLESLNDDLYKIEFKYEVFSKDNAAFKGYGLWFSIDTFKAAFNNDEEFDFFRSYSTAKYRVTEQKTDTKLISDIFNIEI